MIAIGLGSILILSHHLLMEEVPAESGAPRIGETCLCKGAFLIICPFCNRLMRAAAVCAQIMASD